jgi:LacI family transcriptional regulator
VPKPRPTLRDVALLAGVSPATVSRALRDSPLISAETTSRVKTAATSLRYRSDHIGRALRSQTTLSLGLVVPNINNPFFPALVQAVEVAAKSFGWSMLLADSLDSVDVEQENMDVLLGRRVDAIVVSPLHRTKSRPIITAAAEVVPVIQCDRYASRALPYVGVDQDGAMTAVLDHLEATGRRHIAYIGADTGESTAAERLAAFREWAGARDLATNYCVAPSTREGGAGGAARVLARCGDVDAIACCNDAIAVGVLSHLHAQGIAVPDQIAVTGFDNTVMSMVCHPPLTTVIQPLDEVAGRAVAMAKEGAPDERGRILYPATLVARQSTVGPGAPAAWRTPLAQAPGPSTDGSGRRDGH